MARERRYVALLRAVNVGGHGVLSMAKLKAIFEAFGAKDVATFIQSGNVLFTSTESNRARLARALEVHLSEALGAPARVFVYTREDLEKAAAANPFEPAKHEDVRRCHLMFLSEEPEAARRKALMAIDGGDIEFEVKGAVLYYAYPKVIEGRRKTINFERVLGVSGTARTWKVVDQLIALLGEGAAPGKAKPRAKKRTGRR